MTEYVQMVDMSGEHPLRQEYQSKKEQFLAKATLRKMQATSRRRRMKNRKSLVKKGGHNNVIYRGVIRRWTHFFADMFTTLLDAQYRYVLLLILGTFFLSFFVFAVLYWMLSSMNGDFSHLGEAGWQPCIRNVKSFSDCFLLSLETQTTIGFGILFPTGECGGTIPVVYLQVTVGFLMQFFVLTVVFKKLARPKHRRHTLMFSRNACICQEDDSLVLQLRIGDMRRTRLIDATIHGMFVQRHVCQEKYVYPLYQREVEFNVHGMTEGRVFLLWPLVATHRISKESPLYDVRPEDLLLDKFEIMIFLEGTIETTGEPMQARTSYTAKELLWGHRFARIEEYDEVNDIWCMDFARFDNVIPSATLKFSAVDFEEIKNSIRIQMEENSSQLSFIRQEQSRFFSSSSSEDDYNTASETEDDEVQKKNRRQSLARLLSV